MGAISKRNVLTTFPMLKEYADRGSLSYRKIDGGKARPVYTGFDASTACIVHNDLINKAEMKDYLSAHGGDTRKALKTILKSVNWSTYEYLRLNGLIDDKVPDPENGFYNELRYAFRDKSLPKEILDMHKDYNELWTETTKHPSGPDKVDARWMEPWNLTTMYFKKNFCDTAPVLNDRGEFEMWRMLT